MEQYHSLLKRVLGEGQVQFEPRTEEFILGLPGAQSEYKLADGFPLVTTKNVPLKLPGEELLWKLRGDRSVKPLFDRNVHIWDKNAFQHWLKRESLVKQFPKHSPQWKDKFKEYSGWLATRDDAEGLGDLGPVYGFQWRHGFVRDGKEIDQLKNVLEGIRERPGSRYHLMSAWNPAALQDQALGPCPMTHQFSVFGNILHLNVYQRSCDVYLGVPFNIAQDALMLEMVAAETDLPVGKFVHSYGNVHAYLGVPERSTFWTDPRNVAEFQKRFNSIDDREGYLDLKSWYEDTAPGEDELNVGKDHIPYILTQLSKEPREKPILMLTGLEFWDAIQRPLSEVAAVESYRPHKWKSKAGMAV